MRPLICQKFKSSHCYQRKELDRIDTLVQNLLKITKLDAGSIVLEKKPENVAEMMKDVELHFAYRVEQEQKRIVTIWKRRCFCCVATVTGCWRRWIIL